MVVRTYALAAMSHSDATSPDVASSAGARGRWARAVGWLIHSSRLNLVAVTVLVAVAHWPAARLELDKSIESMFSNDDPVLMAFRESREAFGGDEFAFVAYEAPALYFTASSDGEEDDAEGLTTVNPEALEEIKAFADQLGEIDGVVPASTQDLGHMLAPEGDNLPSGIRFLLRMPSIAERAMKFAEGVLVSSDRSTVGIALRLAPADDDPDGRARTIQEIRRMAAAHDPPAIVVGEPVQLADTFRYIEEDGRLLGWSSALLLSVVIGALFRRLRWVVLPLLVVYSSLVLTKATLVLSGLRLSMVSSVLSALVTVIGIATTMHMIVHYRRLRDAEDRSRRGNDQPADVDDPAARRQHDVEQTFIELGPPIFWTCATTALGFLALMSSSILPVRSFGLMMAIGTAMVFVTTMAILPGGMLIGRDSAHVKRYPADRITVGLLERLIEHLRRRGWWWLGGTAVAGVLATWGLFGLKVETDFSKNFRKSSPIVEALDFFETEMGGAGTWEVLLHTESSLDDGTTDNVRELAEAFRELETEGGATITKVVAVTDGLDLIPNVATRFARQTKTEILNDFQPEFVPNLFNEERGLMRIVLRSNEREPAGEKLALIDQATTLAQTYDPKAEATGTFLLLALMVDSLLADQWTSFALATVAIVLAMMAAFRSALYGLISFVPNSLPIAMVIGSIGWLDIPVNMGTAMIASVSVGLTVDSSIHYLAGYRRSRRRGLAHWDALKRVHSGTGRALVYAHIALVGGFSVLALSNFVPLVYFGVLVSAAMLVGLFGVLIVLPMLLTLAEPRNKEPDPTVVTSVANSAAPA